MAENKVIGDLGDIRVALIDADIADGVKAELIALIDEKMEKYRGKEVIIND